MSAAQSKIFETNGHRVRVLIVDDEPAVVRLVDRLLREAGCETATATSGADALTIAEQQPRFDLLITDVIMPEMRGYELAARLQYRQPDLPVLYLTGYSDDLFREKSHLWEHEAYLDKPCSVQGLLEAVSLMVTAPAPRAAIRRSYLDEFRALLRA